MVVVPAGRSGGNGWLWSFFVLLVSRVDPGFFEVCFFSKTGALPEDYSHLRDF